MGGVNDSYLEYTCTKNIKEKKEGGLAKKINQKLSIIFQHTRLFQSYDENPFANRKFKNQLTIKKRHQKFDYTTITDRLRMASWGNNSHPTGVVKPVYGYLTFPLTGKAV